MFFFFCQFIAPALMIELLLVFGGFERKKQARSVPESDGFADVQCFCGHRRPCSVVKGPKHIPV